MVPAYLEHLPIIPMTVANKADHKKLPAPKGPRFSVGAAKFVAPRGETETILAGALAEVLKLERVSAEDNFFKDLGAHSLLMARFCAKIRQHPGLSGVSMRDIYLNPTIAKLAAHLGAAAVAETRSPARQEPFRIPSNLEYYGCGALQLLFYAVYGSLALWLLAAGFEWTYAVVDGRLELYLRLVSYGFGDLRPAQRHSDRRQVAADRQVEAGGDPDLEPALLPLLGGEDARAKRADGGVPGTPIYNLYLRLLGAKIGRNTVISSRFVPVCTDLFSVGDNTILQKDSILLGYKAQSNYIYTGPIAIGDNAYVGQASVLDIDTAMGNDTQLGHASSLQSGQRVPDGKRYHGSPAQETQADYCPVERMELQLAAALALCRHPSWSSAWRSSRRSRS